MAKTLVLDEADLSDLVDLLADAVVKRIEPLLGPTGRRLVDRATMAEIAGISVPMLDRLVSAGKIPSTQVGSCRRFEPDLVIVALRDSDETPEIKIANQQAG